MIPPTSGVCPGRLSDWQRRIVGSCYAFLGWRTAGAGVQFEPENLIGVGCDQVQPI